MEQHMNSYPKMRDVLEWHYTMSYRSCLWSKASCFFLVFLGFSSVPSKLYLNTFHIIWIVIEEINCQINLLFKHIM